MRVMVLSWDAAPDAVGTLDPATAELVRELRHRGTDVHVLAPGGDAPTRHDIHDGVDVAWVGEAPPVIPDGGDALLSRVLALNTRAFTAAASVLRQHDVDVLVARGWQTAYAAINLRQTYAVPLLAVLDGTSHGRSGRTLEGDDLLIHQVEWWLTYEARRVVAPSDAAAAQLERDFQLPQTKIDVIPEADADAYATALARTIADERTLRGDDGERPPLREVLIRALDLSNGGA